MADMALFCSLGPLLLLLQAAEMRMHLLRVDPVDLMLASASLRHIEDKIG